MIGALFLLGLPAFALWRKHRNPHWTPFSTLFATPRELNAALSRVRFTSVPTPALTSALDPGMTSEHVKSVNVTLASETDHGKIKEEAKNAKALGFHNTSKALEAKADAIGQAKAKGATDEDIHRAQLAAQSQQAPSAAVTHAAGWDGYGIDRHRSYERRGYGDAGQWGRSQWEWPHHHHHHQEYGGEFGGEFGGEEMDPRMLRWLMRMMMQQHPHNHRHRHHEFGDFGFEETPMPHHHRVPRHEEMFETRGPHPMHPMHGGGHFGHHPGFGYGGAIDPMLFYPQDDLMLDDDMGGF